MKNERERQARRFTVFALLFLIFFSGCARREGITRNNAQTPERPLIVVSILPQEWFVSRIGGDRFQTLVLAGPGQNPHDYEASPKQISLLAGAGAWILSGADFEISLRPKIERLFPALPVIDGTEGVAFRRLEEHEHDDDDNEHSPLEIDRHTWLGCQPAKILAAHIGETLAAIDPAGAELYERNLHALQGDIDAEFAFLRSELAPLYGRNVFVYHPSFGYFLDEFGMRQQAVETGGKSPGPRDLSRLIALAKLEKPAAVFVQAQFPAAAAKTVA
ncbi:MAG: zinc ABC transporter substrate-binding protein, partial [Treponema sp.]|nr:zinc ABC transporter substrate-binding protein [Treponema sp.]